MMVTFVSECEKKALPKTRRVLDAFANRIGSRTWQTVITNEGLLAVKKLLRKTASKNTAVSCHWIRSRSRSELVWIVGNRRKFNAEGVVPVNLTQEIHSKPEDFSLNTHVIALLSQLAGLFHDIGKANKLFQDKIDPTIESGSFEPYRHEWVSLRLFQAFVDGRSDDKWLSELKNINHANEKQLIQKLSGLRDGIDHEPANPLLVLSPVARMVAWLVVSHHKLPQYPKSGGTSPSLEAIEKWQQQFDACWNTPQCLKDDWSASDIESNWQFPYGTPFKSALWQTKVSIVAKEILNYSRIFSQDWFNQHYTAHLSRLCLMLSDHFYSSQPDTTPDSQDRNYLAYANTNKDSLGKKYLKQKLDEHNIEVGQHARLIAKTLPSLKSELPALQTNKAFSNNVPREYQDDFGWQDKAYNLALSVKDDAKKYGFFGISKASTGKGKTRANARIMYALSERGKCRFSVALGLRTLTLQTGNALKKDLKLADDELALLIGSQAVKELHQQSAEPDNSLYQEQGSESAEYLLKDEITLVESLPPYTGKGHEWFEHDKKILKLLQAPVLVSTIDYLMPANEGIRGGRQIAPMLRLLTSDLVLDEPDDFGLEDYPALCRLVNWAGMLGSRVLLSTATIPPVLAKSLFKAYQEGRKHYTQANGELGETTQICCAWFDEFKKPQSEIVGTSEAFDQAHSKFVDKRITKLKEKGTGLRRAKLIDVIRQPETKPSQAFTQAVHNAVITLHKQNNTCLGQQRVSIGLVRMANIDPLVAVAKHFAAIPAPDNTIIHLCVYHSQFPLLQRSSIETMLDKALNRQDEKAWAKQSGIPEIIEKHTQTNHIFVVLATSVAEVGRDHDYDWAVVEPSSMRSIIQLAGRVQRHRKKPPETENIHILSQNFKGLKDINGKKPCFEKPGFESKKLRYYSTKLCDLVNDNEFSDISAIPRIKTPELVLTRTVPPQFKTFNGLEHFSQELRLEGNKNVSNHAAQWWQEGVTWCGELQKHQPFRASEPNDDYRLIFTRTNRAQWQKKVEKTYPAEYENTNDISKKPESTKQAKNTVWWGEFNLHDGIDQLAKKLKRSEEQVVKIFTHVSLKKFSSDSDERWQYHNALGIYRTLKKDMYSND